MAAHQLTPTMQTPFDGCRGKRQKSSDLSYPPLFKAIAAGIPTIHDFIEQDGGFATFADSMGINTEMMGQNIWQLLEQLWPIALQEYQQNRGWDELMRLFPEISRG